MTALPIIALVLVPLIGAAACRARRPFGALVALAFEAGLLLRGPAGQAELLGARFGLEPLGRVVLLVGVATVVAASLAARLPRPRAADPAARSRPPDPLVLAALGLTAGALLVRDSLPTAVLLLESTALLLALAGLRDGRGAVRAVVRYVVSASLACLALAAGALLLEVAGATRPAVALLVVGLAALSAAFPFHLWLPGLTEEAGVGDAPLVLALVSSPAAALVASTLRAGEYPLAAYPDSRLLVAAGILSAGAAALLALGARPARRLAYLGSASLAVGLVGLADRSDVGLIGGLLTIAVAPPACLLGQVCLRELGLLGAARGRAVDETMLGLAAGRPTLVLGLAVATLSLAGMPLLAGFAGRWAVYSAVAAAGSGYLLGALAATLLGVVAAGRLLSPLLLPPGERSAPGSRAQTALVGALCLALLALGLLPAPVVVAIQAALQAPAG